MTNFVNRLAERKTVVRAEISERANRCYFGYLSPGSHELESGAYLEAQENATVLQRLRGELAFINEQLGLVNCPYCAGSGEVIGGSGTVSDLSAVDGPLLPNQTCSECKGAGEVPSKSG